MSTETTDNNSEISALRNQVFVLLIALIVVSGTLAVYMFRQASLMRKDIDAFKQQTQPIMTAYNQNKALIGNFESQLIAYGKTHPDFVPILAKYGFVQQVAAPAAPAAPAAAPKK
jgi:hypothetical protein